MENESVKGDLLTVKILGMNTSQTDTTIKEGVNCMAEVTVSNPPTNLVSIPIEFVSDSIPPTSSKKPCGAAHDLRKKNRESRQQQDQLHEEKN